MEKESAIPEQFLKINPDWRGMIIWRIEQFELVKWNDHGAFFTGDSFLIYHSYLKGTSKRIIQDIYFWLGSESSTDEKGTAAMMAVILDERFGGSATQHREIQYHESEKFRKLFDPFGGIRYMDGGVDSGFKTVSNERQTVLYQIKGSKNPVLQQVPAKGSSLNQGDVFILHKTGKFFLWIGKKANRMEKLKGVHVLDLLKAKDSKSKIERLEDGDTTPEFWEALGGEVPIPSETEGGDDKEFELSMVKEIVAIEDESFVKIADGINFKPTCLKDSNLIYIIRTGKFLLIWIGKNVKKELKSKAISFGEKYLISNNLPDWVPISTMNENAPNHEYDIAFA